MFSVVDLILGYIVDIIFRNYFELFFRDALRDTLGGGGRTITLKLEPGEVVGGGVPPSLPGCTLGVTVAALLAPPSS